MLNTAFPFVWETALNVYFLRQGQKGDGNQRLYVKGEMHHL